ncbi:hypothetical protein PHLCEN_2v6060 [Hermanssonia centrifuga]|uniref:HAT C-terminal dimerisation domain-containing protein n=1 Tax=Hermanssonia centrifuga TaxID=98765 RepID=A0A2R6P0L5_9APHY|nr:hypothetical protein PHLCEN_2v6060 [Hermanssonia centrifuga]
MGIDDGTEVPNAAELDAGIISSGNIFDALPAFAQSQESVGSADCLQDQLDLYLSTGTEVIKKDETVLQWWYRRQDIYPRLSRMALDYLTIPATVQPELDTEETIEELQDGWDNIVIDNN